MKRLLRRIFLENIGLKVVALALSFVLFLYVQGERRRDAVTGALVKLTLVAPRGKVLTVDLVDKLAVTLRGSRSAVQRLMAEGLAPVEIDLEGRTPGPLHFSSDLIRVPRGLTVEAIQPPQIDVAWEDRAARVAPIVVRAGGTPAAGYRLGQVRVTPTEVTVTGPKSTVESLSEVDLREVRVDGRDHSYEVTVPIQLNRKYVKVKPESVRVSIEVVADIVTKRLSMVPVQLVGSPADVVVELSPRTAQQILIEGPAPALAKLDRSHVRGVIDLREVGELRPGSYLRPARFDGLPQGARVLGTVPASFALVVRRKGSRGGGEDEAP